MIEPQGSFKFDLQLFADESAPAEVTPEEGATSTEFNFDSFLAATGRTPKSAPPPVSVDETEEDNLKEEEEVTPIEEVKGKKEKRSESARGKDIPLIEIKPEEVPKLDLDTFRQQAYQHYLNEGLKQWVPLLQQQGKLGENPSIDEIAAAAGPRSWNELEDWVKRSAHNDSQQYLEKNLKPYVEKMKYNDFTKFLNSLVKVPEFSDMDSYLPKMQEAYDEFVGYFPDMKDGDPRVSLPALYAFVKNREFNKTVKKQVTKKAGQAPILEGKGARHQHGKGAPKDEGYDLLKAVIDKNKNYPLAGIFNG